MATTRSRVSIRDVAAKAGVSSCTVSKVLNGASGRISESTRLLVENVADEIGYRPNRFAKLLGKKRTGIIGVIITNLENPVYAQAVGVLHEMLRERGYQALFEIPISNEVAAKSKEVLEWPVDGFLIWAGQHYDITLTHGPLEGTPMVTVGIPRKDGKPSVAFDLYDGGRQAAEHLLARGCRQLAHVALGTNDPRTQGFCDTARDAGASVELFPIVWQHQTREKGLLIGEEIARRVRTDSRPIEGVFCHNDLLAIGVHRGLQRGGVRIPEEVAVIGLDGIAEGRFLEKPLTTVAASMEELCAAAVDTLLAQIAGNREAPSQTLLVPVRLLLGETA